MDELTKLSASNVQSWLSSRPVYNGSVVDLKLDEQIKLVTGDGRQGYLPDAPYDAIHVGAAAPSIPQAVSNFMWTVTAYSPLRFFIKLRYNSSSTCCKFI